MKQTVHSGKFCIRVNYSLYQLTFCLSFIFMLLLDRTGVTKREYFLRQEGPRGWILLETAYPKIVNGH